ncbi:MAG: hypothetical protein ACLGG7_04020, partial [Bacteriovoracia bacterium]
GLRGPLGKIQGVLATFKVRRGEVEDLTIVMRKVLVALKATPEGSDGRIREGFVLGASGFDQLNRPRRPGGLGRES